MKDLLLAIAGTILMTSVTSVMAQTVSPRYRNPCGQTELNAGHNAMTLATNTENYLHYQTALINFRKAVDACSGYSGVALYVPQQAVVNAESIIWLLQTEGESTLAERCDSLFGIEGNPPMPKKYNDAWTEWNCDQFYSF